MVEPDALRISGSKTSCRLESKVMGLLVALCERPGELWRRDEHSSRIWAGENANEWSACALT